MQTRQIVTTHDESSAHVGERLTDLGRRGTPRPRVRPGRAKVDREPVPGPSDARLGTAPTAHGLEENSDRLSARVERVAPRRPRSNEPHEAPPVALVAGPRAGECDGCIGSLVPLKQSFSQFHYRVSSCSGPGGPPTGPQRGSGPPGGNVARGRSRVWCWAHARRQRVTGSHSSWHPAPL